MLDNKKLKISLVAFYGNKPLELQQLIIELQQLLQQQLASNFIPYDLEQIHATIIGCEGIKTKAGIISKWFYELRNEIKYLNYAGLVNYFLTTKLLPLDISFAGYKIQQDYQFYSNNQHPYYRSFQIKKSETNILIPIVIGWSLKQIITTELDTIRRDLEQFNYLHKYHKLPQDIDNDLYLRIGTIKSNHSFDSIAAIQNQIIDYLGNRAKTTVCLSKENLAFVQYQDLSLPISTTKIYPLAELKHKTKMLRQLYR